MNKIKLCEIGWDCDNASDRQKLPTELIIDFEDLPDYVWEDLEKEIGDYLAEKYGYCNTGYGWKFISTDCTEKKEEKEND